MDTQTERGLLHKLPSQLLQLRDAGSRDDGTPRTRTEMPLFTNPASPRFCFFRTPGELGVHLKVMGWTPVSESEKVGGWGSGDSPRYHLSMAGAAGCFLSGRESYEVLVTQGLDGQSGPPSLHTPAEPTGRKRQRQGGGTGKGALISCLPACWGRLGQDPRESGGDSLTSKVT